jgi:DNA-3-methyladenine glycosylase
MIMDYNKLLKNKINQKFYLEETDVVAKNLIGKLFVKKDTNSLLIARITETEAYLDQNDESSHSSKGITNRNKSMFMIGGTLYVYFIYGVHFCVNIVTKDEGKGAAVLIRSAEPLAGIEIMKQNRQIHNFEKLLIGPGNFAKAFNFNKNDDGKSLLSNDIFISDDNYSTEIITTERIGISKSTNLLLRFYDKNSKFVSKK